MMRPHGMGGTSGSGAPDVLTWPAEQPADDITPTDGHAPCPSLYSRNYSHKISLGRLIVHERRPIVSATRILVLGLLAVRGPMHGHQLRRVAEMINIESWGDVKVGALYGAIHRLEAEGLIHPIRSEQEGRFPARTVYAVTDEGRQELAILRSRALQEARLAPDPFDVALTFVDAELEEVGPLLAQRRAA